MKTISLRLPEQMLNRIRIPANERDVPYKSLMKMFLKERIHREYEPKRKKPFSSRKAKASSAPSITAYKSRIRPEPDAFNSSFNAFPC